MTTDELKDFFETHDFQVFLGEQDGITTAEVESWTDGGVDMIIYLDPFTPKEFFDYVNDFRIDEEIELHRTMKGYSEAFTISKSLKDFTKYHKGLKKVAKDLKKICKI